MYIHHFSFPATIRYKKVVCVHVLFFLSLFTSLKLWGTHVPNFSTNLSENLCWVLSHGRNSFFVLRDLLGNRLPSKVVWNHLRILKIVQRGLPRRDQTSHVWIYVLLTRICQLQRCFANIPSSFSSCLTSMKGHVEHDDFSFLHPWIHLSLKKAYHKKKK